MSTTMDPAHNREERPARLKLWCIDVGRAAHLEQRLSALLDDEERDRADRFARPADALRYRVAHGALRVILSRYTGIGARRLHFSSGAHGKPFLRDGGPHFSLSHSGTLALVAVCADRDVGVDVEELRAIPDAVALARRFFAPKEARAIADQPATCRDLRFMRSWTALEAILKAEGTGLAGDIRGVEIRHTGGGCARASIAGATTWAVRWLDGLSLAERHLGAVAVRGEHLTPLLRRFP